jgi:hypothetical protein
VRNGVRTKIGITLGALALLTGALVSSAGAGIGDSRSPDAIDAATGAQAVPVADYRSPDARNAVLVVRAGIDSRSPDAIDAAVRADTVTRTHAIAVADHRSPDARNPVLVASTGAAPSGLADDVGFSWTDAGIGATGGIALTLLLAGGFLLVRRNGSKVAV